MDAYKDHPARKRAQSAPKAANLPDDIAGWCNQIPAEEKGIYPDRPGRRRLRRRAAVPAGLSLAVADRRDRDPATKTPSATRASEIWNLLESRGITNVHAHGRSYEHVRSRPAVRPPAT